MTDGQVNGRSNDMNTVLIVQLEDLDDNPPEFEFEEKARDPRSECAYAKLLTPDKIQNSLSLDGYRNFISLKHKVGTNNLERNL